jgi:hypothetical protein
MPMPSLVVIAILTSIPLVGISADNDRTLDDYTPGSCTIFSVSNRESAFFCNNEDWFDPETYYWVIPSDLDGYGVLCFGYRNLYPQGGINEKGLAFDANALPRVEVRANPDGLKPYQAIVNVIIMRQCATVVEAIDLAKSYDWSQCYGGQLDGQFMIADPTGDAVVIGANTDGEIVFTRKPQGEGYLVSTNFNLVCPDNRFGNYPCRRYQTVEKMLKQIEPEDGLSADLLAPILDKVSAKGRKLNTIYSNIFDLKKGVAHLYYWHQFDHPVTLDVAEIIARQRQPAQIKTLFPASIVSRAAEEHEGYKKRLLWFFLGCLILLFSGVTFIVIRRVRRASLRDAMSPADRINNPPNPR